MRPATEGSTKIAFDMPNGYDYSAAATGRFYAACIHRVTLPYAAAVIKILLEAGG